MLSDADREREYSPSSCIGGDYRPFIAAYAERSATARIEAEALGGRWLEGRYGAAPTQRLDLCLPPGAPGAPGAAGGGTGLLVFIHGGYWQELSAHESLFAAAQCIGRGLAFAAIDYTLAPQASLAQIVGECRSAMRWLFEQAAGFGIDRTNVVVAGSSAGAHLAAMVSLPAAGPGRPPHPPPRSAVLVSGIYALEPLIGTSVNAALGLDAEAAHAQSPLRHPLAGFPGTVLCWGEIETQAFKRQSLDFAAALRRAGTACTALEVPQRNHFDVVLDLADADTPLGRRTLDLFRANPGRPACSI
jgi:arylformamidase